MTQLYVDSTDPVVLWFRSDLRLHDHPGVAAAINSGRPIVPVYICDQALGTRPLGAASKWWLHRSLKVLDEDLHKFSSRLIIRAGDARAELTRISLEIGAKTIVCARSFDPGLERYDDNLIHSDLGQYVDFERYNATLLTVPGAVRTQEDRPFRVFTPYYKALTTKCPGIADTLPPLSDRAWTAPEAWPHGVSLDSLGLNDTLTRSGHDWAAGFDRFTPGERGARGALRKFLRDHLRSYATARDYPDREVTSFLSPHLRFGEISPQRILHELGRFADAEPDLAATAEKFRSELAWRDFSYQLLDQQPKFDTVNFRSEFDGFPWRDDDAGFAAWCRGETGYDLVDAGMRELWRTGYMHNRVRMVCASFLVKHLLIDWRRGEQWFWDCLLDADPANNPVSWQWVAGSGADAAPYFRIFNPLTQAEKFDPAGAYRKRYGTFGSQNDLFSTRPAPIVDHAFARQRALAAYQDMRANSESYE